MKKIMQTISKSLKKACSERSITNEIDQTMEYMLPFIEDAEMAREKYYNSPSIQNGARRSEAEQKAKNAIECASQHLWETWEREWRSDVTECEFVALIIQSLKRLHPQGEEPINDESKVWIRYINKELFK